jgi:CHASE1-domain containing sensor protein
MKMANISFYKNKKYVCILGFLAFFIFLSCLFTLYRFAESRALKRYDSLAQVQIARRLQEVISSRILFLTTLANYFKTNDISDEKTFHIHAAKFSDNLPEFFAINWIDPDGVIRWVYPEDRNKDAKNKNLLLREEISKYLTQAKEERRYILSHVVKLYQGPRGFTFYYPIFNNKFKGWLNGVFTYEDILKEFIIQNDFDQFNILIKDSTTNYSTFEYGSLNTSKVSPHEVQVLNQKFSIYIEPRKNFLDYSQNVTTVLIYLSSLIISLLLTYFIFRISMQNDLLERINAKLRLSNSIVGVLTHDFSNQILIISPIAPIFDISVSLFFVYTLLYI